MTHHKKFIWQLGLCIALSIAVILLLNSNPIFSAHQFLYWFVTFIFIIISIASYVFGLRAFHSSNKYDFSNLFIIITTFKIFVFLLTFILYQILVEPSNKLYILPFFIIYFIFTSFEVRLLTKIGKEGEY